MFFFIIIFYLVPFSLSVKPNYNIITARVNEVQNFSVSSSNVFIIYYNYSYLEQTNKETVLRIRIESEIIHNETILVILKNDNDFINSIKLLNQNKQSTVVAERTICPFFNVRTFELIVEVSSNYSILTPVSVNLFEIHNFLLASEISQNISITVNTPVYFLFNLDDKIYNSIVKVHSTDKFCMILSIQHATCPVHDEPSNVKINGVYETVTKSGTITIRNGEIFKDRLFIVLVLDQSDDNCQGNNLLDIVPTNNSYIRNKNVYLMIKGVDMEYYWPIFGAIGFFLLFYLASPIISIFYGFCCIKQTTEKVEIESVSEEEMGVSIQGPSSYGSILEKADMRTMYNSKLPHRLETEMKQIIDEESYDILKDALTNPSVYRLNKYLTIPYLTKKPAEILDVKHFLYLWYLIIISVFYALPAVQLVINYQETLQNTGNLDMCYYNFRCTRPWLIFTAFNNIISNVGYIFLGILFTLITKRRERLYNEIKLLRVNVNHNHGIPQFHGIYYAMGLSLAMEGLMSASYHVCPSHRNFQFDTAYMYILSCLIVVKIYQTRHPDINSTAHSFFMTMALFIFLGVVGVVAGNLYFKVFFTIFVFIGCILLSCEIYYVGNWNLDIGVFIRIYHLILNDRWKIFIPTYKSRMIMLIIQNIANFTMVLYFAISKPYRFQNSFLSLLMMNVLLYFSIYIVMKIIQGERLTRLSLFYVAIASVCWGCAMYCFINAPTDWEEPPAGSRVKNKNCILLEFYDIHDIWHFLSAMAMFFSFMGVQNIDDDLFQIERDKIHVF